MVIPVPYDATTSYRGGARDGPAAIIAASRHLEEYDIELDRDISTMGIHTTPEIQPDVSGPKALVAQVRSAVQAVASRGKLPVLLGGEHTITIGAVQALARGIPGALRACTSTPTPTCGTATWAAAGVTPPSLGGCARPSP